MTVWTVKYTAGWGIAPGPREGSWGSGCSDTTRGAFETPPPNRSYLRWMSYSESREPGLGSATDIVGRLAGTLLDSVSEGLVVFGDRGAMVYANHAARSVLTDKGELVGLTEAAALAKAGLRGVRARRLYGTPADDALAIYVLRIPTLARLADREREAILEALAATNWKLTKAARRLGISRTTLWRRLRQYGLARNRRGSGIG